MMLVSDSPALTPFLERTFSFQNADVIHYSNPIKAMDNLEEIQPEVVLFAATDYPRHWKPFVLFMRTTFARHESVFILMINDEFPAEEAAKAEHLEVNAVLDEDLTSQQTVERIRAVITRYHQNIDIRRSIRYIPSPHDRIRFAFVNPYTITVTLGRVIDISTGGLRFEPQRSAGLDQIDPHATISSASLRLGDRLYALRMKVIRVAETIAFEFVDLGIDSERELSDFLATRSARELAPLDADD